MASSSAMLAGKVVLTSQFLCCRAVIPHMMAGGGTIINVSSGNGIAGSASAAAYGAAKAGVIELTKYVATRYGKRGIRCNTEVPGWTVGGTSWAKPEEQRTDAERRFRDNALANVCLPRLADVCLPRLADADDVAPVVAFLASDGGRYVRGRDHRGQRRPAGSRAGPRGRSGGRQLGKVLVRAY
jgi:NAD(P)-dependent dehydrogenase (short-subunit alcohol dehydrogenase family)